jgi:phage FluMu protein Com
MQYVKYRCTQCNIVLQVKPSHTEIIVECDRCKTEFGLLPDINIFI